MAYLTFCTVCKKAGVSSEGICPGCGHILGKEDAAALRINHETLIQELAERQSEHEKRDRRINKYSRNTFIAAIILLALSPILLIFGDGAIAGAALSAGSLVAFSGWFITTFLLPR